VKVGHAVKTAYIHVELFTFVAERTIHLIIKKRTRAIGLREEGWGAKIGDGKEKQLEGDDYLASYRAMKVLRMSENSGYDSHSQVFDTETYTSDLKYFRDRVANAPENQYAVIWDFHF
jgi:hypothetical protein